MPRLSRRAAFVVPAALLAAGASASQDPDAAILSACAAYQAARVEQERLSALPHYGFRDPRELAIEAQINAAAAAMDAAVEHAASVSAQTMGGIRAKAALITQVVPTAIADCELSTEDCEYRLVMSLCRDLAGMAVS